MGDTITESLVLANIETGTKLYPHLILKIRDLASSLGSEKSLLFVVAVSTVDGTVMPYEEALKQ